MDLMRERSAMMDTDEIEPSFGGQLQEKKEELARYTIYGHAFSDQLETNINH